MEAVREALIVATDTFQDSKLRSLRAPARDAEELARVLGDKEIGEFHVQVSMNEPDHVVRRRLSEFFRERSREDLLLLHMSSHGLKDEDGTLYFATTNTEVEHLEATAIPSEFVNRQMSRSRSARMVLLLDCCFGGAFARGFVHRAGEGVDVAEKFNGRGRAVITASRAMEWAFEGDQLQGEARPSIFTSAIVDALETGRADRDQDSLISVDELYDYVYDHVREVTPNQTPSKWTFDVRGDLYVAKSSYRRPIEPAELPLELRAAIESPLAHVRAGAVEELAQLLRGAHPGLRLSARLALDELVADDSRRVSEAASRAIGLEPGQPFRAAPVPEVAPAAEPEQVPSAAEPEQVPSAPPPPRARPREEAARVPADLAWPWAAVLALVGAAALVVGQVVEWGGLTSLIWSPIEAFGVALLAAAVTLASRVIGLIQPVVDGILIGLGLASVAGAFSVEPVSEGAEFVLTLVGGIALLAAGMFSAYLHRAATPVQTPWWAVATGGAGALVLLASLFVDLASEIGPLSEWRPYWLELAAVIAIGAAAAAIAGWLPGYQLYAGGILVAVGIQTGLHFFGILGLLSKLGKNVELGAVLGLVAAGLLLAGGLGVVSAGKRSLRPGRGVLEEAAAGPTDRRR